MNNEQMDGGNQDRNYARANMGHDPGRHFFRTGIFIVPFHDLSIHA